MSTNAEAVRPGISWNATRAASVLMIVVIAVIALVFWPSFDASEPDTALPRTTQGVAAPHEPVVVDGEVCVQCRP